MGSAGPERPGRPKENGGSGETPIPIPIPTVCDGGNAPARKPYMLFGCAGGCEPRPRRGANGAAAGRSEAAGERRCCSATPDPTGCTCIFGGDTKSAGEDEGVSRMPHRRATRLFLVRTPVRHATHGFFKPLPRPLLGDRAVEGSADADSNHAFGLLLKAGAQEREEGESAAARRCVRRRAKAAGSAVP